MSKKLKRSAVALVLAATMVFSSQGVLTAFAVGENETSTAVDVSALEPILDKEETDVANESGNVNDDPLENVCEICGGADGQHTEDCTVNQQPENTCPVCSGVDGQHEEGCSANQQPENTCPVCGGVDGQHTEDCTANQQPDEGDSGETTCPVCGGVDGQHTEDCTANQQPDEGDSGETTCPECGGVDGQHEENCSLAQESDNTPSEEDVAAAKNVSDLIGALPEASTLDPETTDLEALTAQVKAARAAYDALTEEQKAAFDKALLDKLTALEGALEGLQQVETVPETDVTIINESTSDQTFNIGDNQAIVVNSTSDSVITISNCVFNLSGEAIFINGSGVGSNGETKTKMGIGNNVLFIDCTINVSSGQTSYGSGNHCAIGLFGEANFENCKISISDWTGQGLGLYGDANVTFTNSTLSADGVKGSWSYAMYNSSVLTLDSSSMSATNMEPISGNINAFYSGDLKTNYDAIFIENHSTVHFYENKAGGFAINSVNIHVSENSNVIVENNSGNGSNSGHWYVDNSTLNMSNNGCHGLSAESLFASNNSNIIIDGNGYYGSQIRNGFEIDGTSTMTVTGNSHKGDFAGLNLTANVTNGLVEDGAIINISGNYCSGLSNRGTCTFEEGVKLTITNNENDMGGETSSHGGGVYNVGTSANLTLPSDAVIYNNHALTDGDDIYNTGSITFGPVGDNWILNDTNLPITNWFYDGKKDGEDTNRWSVGNYYEVFTPGTITGLQAIKAAHPYSYNPDTPVTPSDPVDWETSKSKTATNLDANYESQVTLSLPAADFKSEIDVVFVIDDTHAGSGIFSGSVQKLLDELCAKNNLDVNVGIVTFDAVARDWLDVTSNGSISGLVPLDENYDAIIDAVNTQLSYSSTGEEMKIGGTNTEAAVEKANEMLSSGTGSEQHVVMFSDMYGYVYYGDLTVGGETYHNVPLSKRHQNYELGQLCIAPPMYDTWAEVYAGQGQDNATYDTFFRDSSWDKYWSIYTSASPSINDAPKGGTEYGVKYFTPFEKSSCMTYDAIMQLMNSGVKVTIVNNDFNPGENGATIQAIKDGMLADLASKGATVIQKDTANGEPLDATQMEEVFTALENKLLYVVDAGSQVIDVIGEGTDNMGNAYDFDFVDVVSLTVGGEPLEIHHEDNSNVYYFGSADNNGIYPFVLTYYPDGLGVATMSAENVIAGELFVWDINVPITVDETVQLTYTVKLTNPQTAAGTYGQYDEDGSEGYNSLYTNNSAILYPVDSNGVSGEPEAFLKPTVSYTVGGGTVPGTDPTPDPDPTPDRPSRPNRDDDDWEPLPNAPVKEDKPAAQTPAQQETETPTAQQPDKYNPETGDTTTVFAAMALAAVSLGGVVLLGRKKK